MVENQNLTVIDSEVICNQQVNVYGTRENPLFLAKDVANWLVIQIHQKCYPILMRMRK